MGEGNISRFMQEIPDRIERAANGSVDDARALLSYFCDVVQERAPVHPAMLKYLSRAFGAILKDPKADLMRALGLRQSRRGNPGGKAAGRILTQDERIEAGICFATLIVQGEKYAVAESQVAEQFGVSRATAKAAYTEWLESQKS